MPPYELQQGIYPQTGRIPGARSASPAQIPAEEFGQVGIYPRNLQQPGLRTGTVPPTIVHPTPPDPIFRDKTSYTPHYTRKGDRFWNLRPPSSPSFTSKQQRGAQASLRLDPQAPTGTLQDRRRDYGYAWSTPAQPLHFGRYLKWESDTLLKGLWRLDNVVLTNGIAKGLDNAGRYMQAYAKANAPWEDDSGRAREGLHYRIEAPDFTGGRRARGAGTQMILELAYDVYYGIYLELPGITRKRQSYAIVAPTLAMFSGLVKEFVKRAITVELNDKSWQELTSDVEEEILFNLFKHPSIGKGDVTDSANFQEYISDMRASREAQLVERGLLTGVIEPPSAEFPIHLYRQTEPKIYPALRF